MKELSKLDTQNSHYTKYKAYEYGGPEVCTQDPSSNWHNRFMDTNIHLIKNIRKDPFQYIYEDDCYITITRPDVWALNSSKASLTWSSMEAT